MVSVSNLTFVIPALELNMKDTDCMQPSDGLQLHFTQNGRKQVSGKQEQADFCYNNAVNINKNKF